MRLDPKKHYIGIACPNLVASHYAQFQGDSQRDVRKQAEAAGWKFGTKKGEARVCPKCSPQTTPEESVIRG